MANESNTVSMNVSLPEQMKKYVDDEVSSGIYSSASEYVRAAIREKWKREQDRAGARAELIQKLEDGLNSGESIVVNDSYWEKRKAAFEARFRKQATKA